MEAPALELNQLRYRWPDSTAALLEIPHWQLARGQRVFLHGASGSGKSTLLGLLAGILVPQSGSCKVLGRDLARMASAERDRWRADHIGFIFQQFNLIPYLPVLANVTLPCRLSQQRCKAAQDVTASAVQLLRRVDIPESLWHKPAMHLSIGQQQRVAAARALIGHPELVIADEPTSALDADRQRDFLTLLGEVCTEAQATLIYVSHDARLAAGFDRSVALAELNTRAPEVSPHV